MSPEHSVPKKCLQNHKRYSAKLHLFDLTARNLEQMIEESMARGRHSKQLFCCVRTRAEGSILNTLKSQQQRVRIQVFLAFKSSDTYPCQEKKKKRKKKDAFIALLNPPRTCPPSSSLSCFAGQRLCMKTFKFVVF